MDEVRVKCSQDLSNSNSWQGQEGEAARESLTAKRPKSEHLYPRTINIQQKAAVKVVCIQV